MLDVLYCRHRIMQMKKIGSEYKHLGNPMQPGKTAMNCKSIRFRHERGKGHRLGTGLNTNGPRFIAKGISQVLQLWHRSCEGCHENPLRGSSKTSEFVLNANEYAIKIFYKLEVYQMKYSHWLTPEIPMKKASDYSKILS